jgi:hypothetical protein
VTVQVFKTMTPAEAWLAAGVKPEFSSSWRIAVASASVARHPKFSTEKVAMTYWRAAGTARVNYISE